MPTKDETSSGSGVLGNLATLFQNDARGSLTSMFYMVNFVQHPRIQKWLEERPKLVAFLGALLTIYWQWKNAKSASEKIMTTVRTWLSADYECHGTDEGFEALYEHIKQHFKPRNISTSYTVRSSFKSKETAMQPGDEAEHDRRETDGNDKIHNFLCEQQLEWEVFFYKGWQPIFLKMKANDINGSGKIVMIGPRRATAVKEILEQASKLQSISRNDETTTFRAQGCGWIGGRPKPQRSTDTVEIVAAEKSRLLKNVDFFVGTTRDKFYAKHGQAYRTGYLFYGPGGTGKTSCVMALAGGTKRNIYKISPLDPYINDNVLMELLVTIPEPSIVLFEDIDSAGIGRELLVAEEDDKHSAIYDNDHQIDDENYDASDDRGLEDEEQPSGVTYSGLLNALDGTDAPEGHIVIMTTNCREQLDDALIRDGRINIQLYFRYATKETARDMYTCIMGDSVTTFLLAEKREDDSHLLSKYHNITEKDDCQKITSRPEETFEERFRIKPAECIEKATHALIEAPIVGGDDRNSLIISSSSISGDDSDASTVVRNPVLQALAEQFASKIPNDTFTPAQLQVYLFTYIDDPEGAIDGLEEWKDRKMIEHKQREEEKARAAEKRQAKLEADRQRAAIIKEARRQQAAIAKSQLQLQRQLANHARIAAPNQQVTHQQGHKQPKRGYGGKNRG